MKGLEQGKLKLSVASTTKYFVPRMLGRFCQAHPQIDISLQVLNRDGVVGRLRSNLDDLYVLSMPPRDIPHEGRTLLQNPLVVVAPLGHKLTERTTLRWQQLQGVPFILREPGSGTRMAVDNHFAALGLTPRVRLELGSIEAIKQAVAADMGVTVLSRHALAADPASEGLAVLKVQRFPVQSSWFVLWPQGKKLLPLATEFLIHLEELARDWEVHT